MTRSGRPVSPLGRGGGANPLTSCVNCDGPVPGPVLYCSAVCEEEAGTIRYVRRCWSEGRHLQPDVAEAIRIRVAWLMSGGYTARQRFLAAEVRQAVFERDGRLCQLCHQAEATEIDHIYGDSGELANLQAVCHGCHVQKTVAQLKPLEGPLTADQELVRARLQARSPLRDCDDHMAWPKSWQRMRRERRLYWEKT
jgi:hypothetical protein